MRRREPLADLPQPQHIELSNEGQALTCCPILRPRRGTQPLHRRRRFFEHVFEYVIAVRQRWVRQVGQLHFLELKY